MRRFVGLLALLCTVAGSVVAQDSPLSTDVLDRFVTAHDREREELAALDPKLAEIDQRIRRFRECRVAFETADSATRSRLGGLAARAGIRARCGANNEEEIEREKVTLRNEAIGRAAQAGGFTVPQFGRLRTRLERIYAYGDRAGLSAPELEAIDARRERFGSIYPGAAAVAGALDGLGRSGSGRPMPGQWTADMTWLYIGQLWAMMYGTGANLFDEAYQPGQWTRWELRGADDDDRATVERAFLSRAEDGAEWWRYQWVQERDTITLEGLFKPAGDGQLQLVRMRGKMPGDREPNELMVPENMTMLRAWGMFGTKPTKESVDGATVGTESVTTPAGAFSARRVRFGGGGATQEWWLTDRVPGGWAQYVVSAKDEDDGFRMVLVAHGTGATSVLGTR